MPCHHARSLVSLIIHTSTFLTRYPLSLTAWHSLCMLITWHLANGAVPHTHTNNSRHISAVHCSTLTLVSMSIALYLRVIHKMNSYPIILKNTLINTSCRLIKFTEKNIQIIFKRKWASLTDHSRSVARAITTRINEKLLTVERNWWSFYYYFRH